MNKFDFRKVNVQFSFDGDSKIIDISKQLGNLINNNTSDFATSDFAKDIYYKGEVEIPKEMVIPCTTIITKSDLIVPVKRALLKAFE